MKARVPEKDKRPGVSYAVSADGLELPAIDVTHPAFAVGLDAEGMKRLAEAFARGAHYRPPLPAPLLRLMARLFLRRSRLGRGLSQAVGGVVDGMTLYLAKLGPANLGRGWAGRIDRRIAGALPSVQARLRLEDMARLLARGLASALIDRPGRPLHLLNIAGGPGADSWNALLLLRQDARTGLEGRPIVIHVLDRDVDGPAFGSRAVEALTGPAGALHGLDVSLRHVPYDWHEVGPLGRLLDQAGRSEAVVGCSSEGGLFEYGSDEDIVANLDALRLGTPADTTVAGSVTRPGRAVAAMPQFSIHPRSPEVFGGLARRAGWEMAEVIERVFSNNVRLARAS